MRWPKGFPCYSGGCFRNPQAEGGDVAALTQSVGDARGGVEKERGDASCPRGASTPSACRCGAFGGMDELLEAIFTAALSLAREPPCLSYMTWFPERRNEKTCLFLNK